MEDEWIKVVRNWSEPKSVQDIQVFISFANFFQCFIRGFSGTAALLTSLLKTTKLSNSAPKPGAHNNEVVKGGGKVDDRNLSKKPKNIKSGIRTCIGVIEESTFLTFDAKEAFNQLRQAFIKVPIFQYFDLECYIWIETNLQAM